MESSVNTMCGSSNMYSVKVSTNMSSAKVVILVLDFLELMLFLHHDARILSKR
jgi:hypothetical protein